MNPSGPSGEVRWRIHLRSPPEVVFPFLATDEGRSAFWAESAQEWSGAVHFTFPNGAGWTGRILATEPHRRFSVEYYFGTVTTFELVPDGHGGTELTVLDSGVRPDWREEVSAGWVSVLLALKAAADHGIDLRNHDPGRTWDQGFADN